MIGANGPKGRKVAYPGERARIDQFRRSVLSESSFIAESDVKETKQRRPGKPATLYSLRDWADPTKDLSGKSDYSD